MEKKEIYYATGKRKTAIARTWITPGSGQIVINGRAMDEYFPVPNIRLKLSQPFDLTNNAGAWDVRVKVVGGGVSGQASAVRHGITKALVLANPDLRQTLKRAGFVKRDPRVKERKKYGQKGARARFQFSKR